MKIISELTLDGIMTLVGSLLGTFLAGLFTLKSVNKQIKHAEESKEKDEKELSTKILYDVHAKSDIYLKDYKVLINKLKGELNNEQGIRKETLNSINNLINNGESLGEELKYIDYYKLSFEVYTSSRIIPMMITILQGQLVFLKKQQEIKVVTVTKNDIEEITKNINELEKELEFIYKYIKNNV